MCCSACLFLAIATLLKWKLSDQGSNFYVGNMMKFLGFSQIGTRDWFSFCYNVGTFGIPILFCFFFAGRPLRFGLAVGALFLGSMYFGVRDDERTLEHAAPTSASSAFCKMSKLRAISMKRNSFHRTSKRMRKAIHPAAIRLHLPDARHDLPWPQLHVQTQPMTRPNAISAGWRRHITIVMAPSAS